MRKDLQTNTGYKN